MHCECCTALRIDLYIGGVNWRSRILAKRQVLTMRDLLLPTRSKLRANRRQRQTVGIEPFKNLSLGAEYAVHTTKALNVSRRYVVNNRDIWLR